MRRWFTRLSSKFSVAAVFATLFASGCLLILRMPAQIAVRNQGYVPFSDAPIFYRSQPLHDPVAELERQLESGATSLTYDDAQGYLKSVLQHLNITVSSQTLVFRRPAFNTRRFRLRLRELFTSTTMSILTLSMTAKRWRLSPSIRCRERSFTCSTRESWTNLLSNAPSLTARNGEHGEGSEVGASLNVPDLRSPAVQKNDDGFLHQIIKKGKGNMPTFGRDFSDEEIDRLIQLVRSFTKHGKEKSP